MTYYFLDFLTMNRGCVLEGFSDNERPERY